jgi:hypothetical protein
MLTWGWDVDLKKIAYVSLIFHAGDVGLSFMS